MLLSTLQRAWNPARAKAFSSALKRALVRSSAVHHLKVVARKTEIVLKHAGLRESPPHGLFQYPSCTEHNCHLGFVRNPSWHYFPLLSTSDNWCAVIAISAVIGGWPGGDAVAR